MTLWHKFEAKHVHLILLQEHLWPFYSLCASRCVSRYDLDILCILSLIKPQQAEHTLAVRRILLFFKVFFSQSVTYLRFQ